jgi:hypothetical protein
LVHARDWVFHFFAGKPYARAFRGQLILAQILGGAKADARAERSQQQFGRGHAFVEAATVRRLIADDGVPTSFDLELDCS